MLSELEEARKASAEVSNFNDKLASLQSELDTASKSRSELETRLKQVAEHRDRLQQEVEEEQEEANRSSAELVSTEGEIKDLRSQVDKLKTAATSNANEHAVSFAQCDERKSSMITGHSKGFTRKV